MSGFIACGHNPLDDPWDRDENDYPYDSSVEEEEPYEEELARKEREFQEWNPDYNDDWNGPS